MKKNTATAFIQIACLAVSLLFTINGAYAVEYDDGVNAYNAREYNRAIELFNELLQSSPPLDLQDNIHFWLGESNYACGDLLRALYHFECVFTISGANKRDDALLKIAICYRQLTLNDNACATLNSLDQLYLAPDAQDKRRRVRERYCGNNE